MSADPLFDRLARALAGRYTLVRELGQGGMATVYLGTDLKLGRQVAIKALPPTTRAYLGSGRFQREVLLAAQLSHPHIVPLFEADEADGILFYVMGYVEGESLKDRLAREGPLPLADALRIAAEVGDALQYAHEVGVLHRDVKPANILLSRAHAMVADFGIAKLMEQVKGGQSSLTGAGLTPGTAEYMSPEQAGGAERLDARSDVYALAAVLYEMLVGEPPFTGPNVQAIVARVLTERPRPPRPGRPQVPPHVEHAIASGLAKVPADRPPSARAFVDLLTQPAAGRWRPTRRQLAVTALGAAGIVAAALGIRGLTRRPHPPPEMALVPAGRYPVGGAPWREASTVRLGSLYIDSTKGTLGAYPRDLGPAPGVAPPGGAGPQGGARPHHQGRCVRFTAPEHGGRLPSGLPRPAPSTGAPGVPLRPERRGAARPGPATGQRGGPVLREPGQRRRLSGRRPHRSNHNEARPGRAFHGEVPERRTTLSWDVDRRSGSPGTGARRHVSGERQRAPYGSAWVTRQRGARAGGDRRARLGRTVRSGRPRTAGGRGGGGARGGDRARRRPRPRRADRARAALHPRPGCLRPLSARELRARAAHTARGGPRDPGVSDGRPPRPRLHAGFGTRRAGIRAVSRLGMAVRRSGARRCTGAW